MVLSVLNNQVTIDLRHLCFIAEETFDPVKQTLWDGCLGEVNSFQGAL